MSSSQPPFTINYNAIPPMRATMPPIAQSTASITVPPINQSTVPPINQSTEPITVPLINQSTASITIPQHLVLNAQINAHPLNAPINPIDDDNPCTHHSSDRGSKRVSNTFKGSKRVVMDQMRIIGVFNEHLCDSNPNPPSIQWNINKNAGTTNAAQCRGYDVPNTICKLQNTNTMNAADNDGDIEIQNNNSSPTDPPPQTNHVIQHNHHNNTPTAPDKDGDTAIESKIGFNGPNIWMTRGSKTILIKQIHIDHETPMPQPHHHQTALNHHETPIKPPINCTTVPQMGNIVASRGLNIALMARVSIIGAFRGLNIVSMDQMSVIRVFQGTNIASKDRVSIIGAFTGLNIVLRVQMIIIGAFEGAFEGSNIALMDRLSIVGTF